MDPHSSPNSIDNVKVLRREDAAMGELICLILRRMLLTLHTVERMRQVGRTALERMGVPEGQQRMGFHIPP